MLAWRTSACCCAKFSRDARAAFVHDRLHDLLLLRQTSATSLRCGTICFFTPCSCQARCRHGYCGAGCRYAAGICTKAMLCKTFAPPVACRQMSAGARLEQISSVLRGNGPAALMSGSSGSHVFKAWCGRPQTPSFGGSRRGCRRCSTATVAVGRDRCRRRDFCCHSW